MVQTNVRRKFVDATLLVLLATAWLSVDAPAPAGALPGVPELDGVRSDFGDGDTEVLWFVVSSGVTTVTYDLTQDWCSAADNDGPAGQAPTGDASSCDHDSTETVVEIVGAGDATGAAGLAAPGCRNEAAETVCSNGLNMLADVASEDGRFGGDYPNATAVELASDGRVGLVFQACWMTQAGVQTCGTPGAAVCLDPLGGTGTFQDYRLSVGGGGSQVATDPPAAATISKVMAGRVAPGPLSPCGSGAESAGPRTVVGTWTYQAQVDDSAASAGLTMADDGNGATCTATYNNSASAHATRYGRADSQVFLGGLAGQAIAQGQGPQQGAAVTATGSVPVAAGQTVHSVVSVWAVGASYKISFVEATCAPAPPAS